MKVDFQKLSKVLRTRNVLLKTKKRVREHYAILVFLYGSEYGTISTELKKRLETAEMWFPRRMPKTQINEKSVSQTNKNK